MSVHSGMKQGIFYTSESLAVFEITPILSFTIPYFTPLI